MSSKTLTQDSVDVVEAEAVKSEQKTIHVLSNTHWDREWRFPYQHTRLLLVDLVDHLIEIMEGCPDYKYYNFDSQTIFLDDYLEFRPENRNRLAALIEGFLSPSSAPYWIKAAVAVLSSGLLMAYFVVLGYPRR